MAKRDGSSSAECKEDDGLAAKKTKPAVEPVNWKERYERVFEYRWPMIHSKHASFQFVEAGSRDQAVWKKSFQQLKKGIHVKHGPIDDPEITRVGTLQEAVQIFDNDTQNEDKLIFVHKGIHEINDTIVVPDDCQIIGASDSDDITSSVTLVGKEKTLLEFKTNTPSYLGYLTVIFDGESVESTGCHVMKLSGPLTKPVMEHCAFSSNHLTSSVIMVEDWAEPSMSMCTIEGSNSTALTIHKAFGDYKMCLFSNCGSGIDVETDTRPFFTEYPVFQDCRISQNRGFGFRISESGALVTNCEIFSNKLGNIKVTKMSNPNFISCSIFDSEQCGILVEGGSKGVFVNNRIYGNKKSAVHIESAEPTFKENRVFGGHANGFYFVDAHGFIACNRIYGNRQAGIQIGDGSEPTIVRNQIYDGDAEGIRVEHGGKGLIEHNTFENIAEAAIVVDAMAMPTVHNNRIIKGKKDGVIFKPFSSGTCCHNTFEDNHGSGVTLETGSTATVNSNTIENNGTGITIFNGAGNEIMGNMIGGSESKGFHLKWDPEDNGIVENTVYDDSTKIQKNQIIGNAVGVEIDLDQNLKNVTQNVVTQNCSTGVHTVDRAQMEQFVKGNNVFNNGPVPSTSHS